MSRRARLIGLVALVAVVAVVAVVGVLLLNQGRDAPTPQASVSPTPTPATTPTAPASAACPQPTVPVSTAGELQAALDEAAPGAVIGLAPGSYPGTFTLARSGTPEAPLTVCGPADAVLDGGRIDDGYVLHLDGVSDVVVSGFSIRNGQKGLMADRTTRSVISGLTVSRVGDEAIHLRDHSTDNLVTGNTISETGARKPKFGEGIYVGTAESNWCDITDCEPDASDRNTISGNTISATTAESIDIKEGTSGGTVEGNVFDGSALEEDDADSWVDVKGNDWVIAGNSGTDSPADGFQTHEIVDGWGTRNVFRGNTAAVNGPGHGFSITPELDNVVECSNTASGAGEGLSNLECSAG